MEKQVIEPKKSFKESKCFKILDKIVHLKYFSLCIWILLIVIVWEMAASYVDGQFRTPENYLPHLYNIFESIFKTKVGQEYGIVMVFKAAGATLSRALVGFGIGVVLGFALALIMDLSKVVEKIAFPYLMLIQMVPIVGMAPIIVAMTKSIDTSRIIIAAILTFYPISANVLAGFKSVESEKHDLMKICATNKVKIYTKTMIPSCLPYFFTGLKIAAPLAITAAILVDTIGGGNSLGSLLSQSLKGGGIPRYVFWQIVFLSAFIGVGSSGIMSLLERVCCPYKFGHFHHKKTKESDSCEK